MDTVFNVHGDNIVECDRVLEHIRRGLNVPSERVVGPLDSVTCPAYIMELDDRRIQFRFLPGYGERRWNQDILGFVKQSGGLLREAADVVLTRVENGAERPLAAIEFCGALPAGNQAWQRHGRALSFAHANIPYFFVAELGGFELDANRTRKAPRMPNPAVPFSLLAMTLHHGSVCLPVYEPNAGASLDTVERYRPVFGQETLRQFLRSVILGKDTGRIVADLCDKCIALVKLLAESRRKQDGLTVDQWQGAYDAARAGQSVPEFLMTAERLLWKKKTSIKQTSTARRFMGLGARYGFGLTSSSLPMSIVPKRWRATFARKARKFYPALTNDFIAWLASDRQNLAIAWLMGFKPKGEDARPDRGLPPMVRMLAGTDSELLTFVYGPVPSAHWEGLTSDPEGLARENGLWEAILGVSDGVLVDSTTGPHRFPYEHLKSTPIAVSRSRPAHLHVSAEVRCLGEQDVDTALHIAFKSLGKDVVFEGMCNPPGGDWSGISFRWSGAGREFRWVTLPRVSAQGGKRPDHVCALFGHGHHVVCLCVESKEVARSLDNNIGPRLSTYTETLFATPPSICRDEESEEWEIHRTVWQLPNTTFASAGAYLSVEEDPFQGLSDDTGLDMQIGLEFRENASHCVLHLRGDTELGRSLVTYIDSHEDWSDLVTVHVSN